MTEPAPATGEIRQKALQEELRQLVDVVGPGPLVDLLLERAFQLRATDIHMDPNPQGLRVRLRVDGLLHDVLELPNEMSSHVVSRIKLMAGMDITERRFAQDGHISSASQKNQRDIRVGSGPSIYGERLVLRLMPDQSQLESLEDLGFEPAQYEKLQRIIQSPYGMLLSVGPVGCGKSTTMYSCLEVLNDPSKSLLTIEDPVERRLDGVTQIQVDTRIDFNFVEALRGVLRQDPDVMMVGEIRDPETAHISVRAGLTGIVVLSTMHANEAASTIDVFREFGIPGMFVGDCIRGIIAQRLVRKLCHHCRTEYLPNEAERHFLGIEDHSLKLFQPQGCEVCFHTGYSGRTGVFEIMLVDDAIRDGILQELPRSEIARIARDSGMMSLEDACRVKVQNGITSIQEMHRVLTSFPI